jgi:hypothetical protein
MSYTSHAGIPDGGLIRAFNKTLTSAELNQGDGPVVYICYSLHHATDITRYNFLHVRSINGVFLMQHKVQNPRSLFSGRDVDLDGRNSGNLIATGLGSTSKLD